MTNHLKWMAHAKQIAKQFGEDPKTKVGAVIVQNNGIVSVGWNHFPEGTPVEYWQDKKLKHAHVIHAEVQALIDGEGNSIVGASLYTTRHPCAQCSLLIADSAIKVVYCPKIVEVDADILHSREILERGGVSITYID